jgi:acetyl esterase/lipase
MLLALALLAAPEPALELLWPAGAPGALGTTDDDRPALLVHLPPRATAVGTGVVVCPGGAYTTLAMGHEGRDVARWLTDRGFAAFVLRYRHGPRYRHPIPLGDVLRAVRLVRARAAEWGVSRVGVWGFSAGGHLASSAATMFDAGNPRAEDPIDRASSRPDFAVLAYPVILMEGESAHARSRQSLLGDSPAPELAHALSTNTRVGPRTPPTFLFHTADDATVSAENSVTFYLALRRAGVPAELHIYEHGRHGAGLAAGEPALRGWTERLAEWLRSDRASPR